MQTMNRLFLLWQEECWARHLKNLHEIILSLTLRHHGGTMSKKGNEINRSILFS